MVSKPEGQCIEMIRKFSAQCAAIGKSKFENLSQRIKEIDDDELFARSYHSSCDKDFVDTGKLKRTDNRFQESSLGGSVSPPQRGRPPSSKLSTTESDSYRHRRSTGKNKFQSCIFRCGSRIEGNFIESKVSAWVKDLCSSKRVV